MKDKNNKKNKNKNKNKMKYKSKAQKTKEELFWKRSEIWRLLDVPNIFRNLP